MSGTGTTGITYKERNPAPKQKREQRRFYVDARIDPNDNTSPIFYLIGEDNEDLTRERSWNSEQKKNVLGVTTTTSTLEGESISVEPFYARQGDAMAVLLQHFDKHDSELDSIKRNYYEAKIDNEGKTIYAFRKTADIMLNSVGGPSEDADNLPFEISLSGAKVEQEFDLATEAFSDKP